MELTDSYTITLWDILKEPWATLHLPRFALFLVFAIILEVLCAKKKTSLLCSWSTVITLCLSTLGGLVILYYMLTTVWVDCIAIPWWYYPLTFACVLTAIVFFVRGAIVLWKEGFHLNSGVRSIVFIVAIYFTTTTIITPTRLNRILAAGEPARIKQSHDFAKMYLDNCREINIVPTLDDWSGEEVKKYQTTVPELIKLREIYEESNAAYHTAGNKSVIEFESLPENEGVSAFEGGHFTPQFRQYLDSDRTALDAMDIARDKEHELNIATLEYMIQDYESKMKIIDTANMRKDLYRK